MRLKHYSIYLLIVSCGAWNSKDLHPLEERLPNSNEITFSVDFTPLVEGEFDLFSEGISNEATHFITSDSTRYISYLGFKEKIDIDESGNIYILHRRSQTVQVYNKEGEFKYALGGPGRGPGEFTKILTFDFSPDYKRLYILGFLDLEVFDLKEGMYSHTFTLQHNMNRVYDMCALDSSIYISGYSVGKGQNQAFRNGEISISDVVISKPITKFSGTELSIDTTFGFRYEATAIPIDSGILSKYHLGCNTKTNMVVGQLFYSPLLFGYSESGELKWITKLENYRTPQALEDYSNIQAPSLTEYYNSEIFDYFQRFREINESKYAFIQSNELPPQGDPKSREKILSNLVYTSLLIDTETGEATVAKDIGLIAARKDSMLITIKIDPKSNKSETVYEIRH